MRIVDWRPVGATRDTPDGCLTGFCVPAPLEVLDGRSAVEARGLVETDARRCQPSLWARRIEFGELGASGVRLNSALHRRPPNPGCMACSGSVRVLSFRWWFESRETGRITIAQFPNWPLFAIGAGWLVRLVVNESSGVYGFAGGSITVLWLFWGADELIRGANPFRRLLGTLVIAWQLIGYVS